MRLSEKLKQGTKAESMLMRVLFWLALVPYMVIVYGILAIVFFVIVFGVLALCLRLIIETIQTPNPVIIIADIVAVTLIVILARNRNIRNGVREFWKQILQNM